MITLPSVPRLTTPSTRFRLSYLIGEQADMVHRGSDTAWLAAASENFDEFTAGRVGIRERWGVPSEVFWFVAEDYYIGSLVLRHELAVDEAGGHIGYHVVYPWQRQGHATAMLRDGLLKAKELGIERAMLTVEPDNIASQVVIKRNGGVEDGMNPVGEMRFWIDLS